MPREKQPECRVTPAVVRIAERNHETSLVLVANEEGGFDPEFFLMTSSLVQVKMWPGDRHEGVNDNVEV